MLRRAVLWLLAAFVLDTVLAPRFAHPAPKAADDAECYVFADMALSARAMVIEGVRSEQIARVFRHVYSLDERGLRLAALIVQTAVNLQGVEPKAFSAELYGQCVRGRGNMDGVLGADV